MVVVTTKEEVYSLSVEYLGGIVGIIEICIF